ncbi:DUF4232 domain-containing protein [Streptomyces sp. NPDC090080]|uniref:DUF4232 domain-containing protein n=1 Tax=Streptomyces sp. NPDC090080 TaxID=3365939 RepID=UPI003809C7FD
MRRKNWATAIAAAVTVTFLTGSAMANASPAKAAVRPCTANNVSFYFGGFSYGLSHRSFDLTLLAHDGITCSLSDTPQVTFNSPPAQTSKIPVTINGRGGTLTLRPDSPLHTTIGFSIPDAPEDKAQVNGLKLAMPDGTSRTTSFLFPGTTDIYKGGIYVTSWETGIGRGEAEGDD